MYDGKQIVGIIPARGGSKGLPKKNVLPLNGIPLIAWSIEQAKTNKYIDKVVVSTDDEEIATVARQYGAEVPFLRPKELASDSAKIYDVIMHALNWLETHHEFFDLILLLQPTSPLRKPVDINSAIELLFSKKAQAVVSVCETEHHPYWSNVLPADGSMKNFLRPEILNCNRQELPIFYRLNGAIYLAYVNYVREHKSFYSDLTYAYVMPLQRSIDIDSEIDFALAELIIERSSS